MSVLCFWCIIVLQYGSLILCRGFGAISLGFNGVLSSDELHQIEGITTGGGRLRGFLFILLYI